MSAFRVTKRVKALKQRTALQRAMGGAPLLGTVQVELAGAEREASLFIERVQGLCATRAAYEGWREAYEAARSQASSSELILAASKAILLLRPQREAIKQPAATATR